MEIMLWKAVSKLTKEMETLNKQVNGYFTDVMKRLDPLIKTLIATKPFIEVFNSISNLFITKGKRK